MIKAGFARVDITPPLGLPLSGYFRKRIAEGVLDPLELNALAVSDEKDTVIIISCDLIGITLKRATELRELISKRTGVPAECIFITAIHQHTSLRIAHFTYDEESAGFDTYRDDAYYDILFRKFGDVAVMAVADMKDATVGTAVQKTAEDISFIRRYVLKDGTLMTNPSTKTPEEIERPNGESDNNVRLVRFKREGAKDIALVNLSTHPDVVSGEKFSADWPGFVRRFVEHDIDDVHCIYVNGAQGDTNHFNVMGGNRSGGYEYARYMGRTVADTVLAIWDKTEEKSCEGIDSEIRIIYNKTNTSGEDRYDEAEAYYKEYLDGKINIRGHLADVAEAKRILCMRDQTMYRKVPVSVVRLGEIAFVGFGGEPFTAYAAKAREAAPERFVISACCTNGYEGYLPTYTAFTEGGYEARSTNFTPELEEQLVSAITEMLGK